MNRINKLKIAYALTLILGILAVYFLAYPNEPLRTQSLQALITQFAFLIGFGFIIGTELSRKPEGEEET